jgi:Na+-transporting NADH:ubiquinone oxidoreductase subunit NqrF
MSQILRVGGDVLIHMLLVVIFAVLVIVVGALIAYGSKLTAREDVTIRIHDGEESQMAEQAVFAARVERLARLGKIVTAVVDADAGLCATRGDPRIHC